ncbi:MAG TPA: hypothetical protein VHR45_05825 [Thermoanaerobaculia bacterium]|nr:hypothetical protein [Thermoanaerobaculia bacterium]
MVADCRTPKLAESRSRTALCLLLASMVLWSGWFIWRTSFVAGGQRVFCLFDDAMISMAYARNLVEGHGLNWARAGEPVEGFSHPLWTFLMVPVNAVPLDLRYRSLLVQLLSLGFLVVHIVLVRSLTLRYFSTERARHWLPAALLTAFYYPLSSWALLGMESGLQALLTTASVLFAFDIVCGGEDRHRELLLVGALAYLLRMDMLLMVIVVQIYVFAHGGVRNRRQLVHWCQGAAVFAGLAAGYSVFRWFYFHDVLPNTYYLKLYRIPLTLRLARGARTLGQTFSEHSLLLTVAVAGAAALHRLRPDRGDLHGRLALLLSLFLVACAYSVYVGGDVWEMSQLVRANRFVVYVMPCVFIVLNALINEAASRIESTNVRRRFTAVATAVALLSADGLWLAEAPAENLKDLTVGRRPALVAAQERNYGGLRTLQGVLGPQGVVAASNAGLPAYFSDYRMVDVFGYNDRHIARLPPALPLGPNGYLRFLPGHMKWDFDFIFAQYHPDAIMAHCFPAWRLLRSGYRPHDGGFWLMEEKGRRPPLIRGGSPLTRAAPRRHLNPALFPLDQAGAEDRVEPRSARAPRSVGSRGVAFAARRRWRAGVH